MVYIVLATVVALRPGIDRKYHLYPFTSFPMFSSIRARTPYDVHAPYTFEGGHIELVAPDALPPDLEATLDRYYAKILRLRTRDELAAALPGMLRNAQRLHPGTTALRAYYAIYEAPAYPARPAIVTRPIALLATIDASGVHSLLGSARVDGDTVTLTPGEPSATPIAIETYIDERPEPHASPFTGWQARTPNGHNVVYVARIGENRWVVAQHDTSRR
jgi:hypothetical protein